jgi:hypothetical protein
MSDSEDKHDSPLLVAESTERFVANKPEHELLHDLKVYLARLRDNPRSLPDRLRVAAIQARLGRSQEALIHYEGVLRGYVAEDQIMNAITLCKRILGQYPEMPRIQRLLAALYARAPHGSTGAVSPVTPIPPLEDQATSHFLVEDPEDEEASTDRNVVVDRVFPELDRPELNRPRMGTPGGVPRYPPPPIPADARPSHEDRPTMPYERQLRPDEYALEDQPTTTAYPEDQPTTTAYPEDQPTTAYLSDEDLETDVIGDGDGDGDGDAPAGDQGDAPVLLTRPKADSGMHPRVPPAAEDDDAELVVLLTKPKKKK